MKRLFAFMVIFAFLFAGLSLFAAKKPGVYFGKVEDGKVTVEFYVNLKELKTKSLKGMLTYLKRKRKLRGREPETIKNIEKKWLPKFKVRKIRKVYLAGDFSGWKPNIEMEKVGKNLYMAVVTLDANSTYKYKYVCKIGKDQLWIWDPSSPRSRLVPDGFAGYNSVLKTPKK